MPHRLMAAAKTAAAILAMILTGRAAAAQALSVLPVNIFLPPGQKATTLTVTNQGKSETAIQVRAYAWNQPDGEDQLTTSDMVVVSPPLATIAPGATQVVRLILRLPPLIRLCGITSNSMRGRCIWWVATKACAMKPSAILCCR